MNNPILDDINKISTVINSFHEEVIALKEYSLSSSEAFEASRRQIYKDYQNELLSLNRAGERILEDYNRNNQRSVESLRSAIELLVQTNNKRIEDTRNKYSQIRQKDDDLIKWLGIIIERLPAKIKKRAKNKPVNISKSPPDLAKIRRLDEMINTDTAESFAKKLTCTGGYYHQSDMQKDLFTLATDAIEYLEYEIQLIQSDCKDEVSRICADSALRKAQLKQSASALEVKKEQEKNQLLKTNQVSQNRAKISRDTKLSRIALDEEKSKKRIEKQLLEIKEKRNAFFESALITDFSKRTLAALVDSGCFNDDWKYQANRESADVFSLGKIQIPITVESKSLLASLSSSLPDFFSQDHFTIPLLLANDKAVKAFFKYDDNSKKKVYDTIQFFVLQKLRSNRANHIQVFFSDPNDRGKNMGVLIAPKEENEKIGIRSEHSRDGIKAVLKELEAHIDKVNGQIGACPSIYEYNKDSDIDIKEIILVLADVQNCIDPDTLPLLKIIWENAERCGINIVLTSESDADQLKIYYPNTRVDWSFIDATTKLSFDCSVSHCSLVESKKKHHFTMPEIKPIIKDFFADYRAKYKDSLKLENRFGKLRSKMIVEAKSEEQKHLGKAIAGVSLPVFIDTERNTICRDFVIGTENAAHMLITGGTGSGKSRLLHSIIASIVLNYHPDDVELWLIDCKKVEFAMFMYDRPEHVRMVSLERTREFAFAFFDYLLEFAKHRTELQLKVGVKKIEDYRSVKNDPYCMPRVVIIIDEFHAIMNQLYQVPFYRIKMEEALSEYRNLGITFIFSDQSLANLKGFDTALKQIHCRVALRGDVNEMKYTLNVSNEHYTRELLEAMESSEGKGDAWWNKYPETRLKNIYISDDRKVNYSNPNKTNLSEEQEFFLEAAKTTPKAQADTKVFLINGNDRERISLSLIRNNILQDKTITDQLYLCLGTPTTLEDTFGFHLIRKNNENILINGIDDEMTIDVLISIIYSLFASNKSHILILSDPFCKLTKRLEGVIPEEVVSFVTIHSDYNTICKDILSIQEKIKAKDPDLENTLVIWLGISDLYDEFVTYSPSPASNVTNNGTNQTNDTFEVKSVQNALQDEQLKEMAEAIGCGVEDLILSMSTISDENDNTSPDDYCYNAINDMLEIFSKGGRLGVHSVVLLESSYDKKHVNGFSLDVFTHRVVFRMSVNESYEFGYGTSTNELTDKLTALYTNGKMNRIFKPYKYLGGVNDV